ncbi:calcium-regulated heat stable protein 1 [Oncorhynchus mykiss]|uniref:Calcium regulated heat stable protein 1 n=1 Tax=Oncorhynchus mykiss TaxID=8022 RepID=A0A8C7NQ78_ONCMY|nr:calcium-regulated heat stable protein 1 [Oncorhynchus mykiss]XP_036798021.1 calcium-regulated heat stable protein 1 [Oncorhynchus mykiss]
MSSEATRIQGSVSPCSTTPPLTSGAPGSPVSPVSPVSPGSLCPPASRYRDRSPSPMRGYLIPSPLPTRRTRTCSAAERAAEGPSFSGVCKCFSRTKGHGFITPADGGSDIFVHISDIEGEYVPMEGDEVSYKVCSIPPKYQKIQAVDVTITHLNPGSKHETWGGALLSSS